MSLSQDLLSDFSIEVEVVRLVNDELVYFAQVRYPGSTWNVDRESKLFHIKFVRKEDIALFSIGKRFKFSINSLSSIY